mmetsp:Transcript_90520/g.235736  ORF Transcript_90520/g.235736 Transcript_90520/m.235736 type:complete len:230 (+) Transcript_90520:218-907(+)
MRIRLLRRSRRRFTLVGFSHGLLRAGMLGNSHVLCREAVLPGAVEEQPLGHVWPSVERGDVLRSGRVLVEEVRRRVPAHQQLDDLVAASLRRAEQRRLTEVVQRVDRVALVQEVLYEVPVAVEGRLVEWRAALVVLEIDGGALLDQKLHDCFVVLPRRLPERGAVERLLAEVEPVVVPWALDTTPLQIKELYPEAVVAVDLTLPREPDELRLVGRRRHACRTVTAWAGA